MPEVAIVLGSGFGDFAKSLKIDKEISFSEIDSFPSTTNKAHKGKFVFARVGSVNVVCMQGRIHYYEGYSLHGTRFPDMTDPYDEKIRNIVKKVAKANKISLKEGIYVQTQGPTFETAAEIKFLKTIGADAVAMSLAVETIAARHAGMNVCGISMITNMATGLAKSKQSDEDVRKNAEKNMSKLEKLILKVVPEIV